VFCESFIEVGIISAQQIEDIAILTHDALEKQFGLAAQGLPEIMRRNPGIGEGQV